MTVITLVCSPLQIEKMKDYYKDYQMPLIQYSTMRAKKNGVSITAYSSGKVVFQGILAPQEAAIWQGASTGGVDKTTKLPKIAPTSLPEGFSSWSLIGSDEVGNGSYFGPLTVCAVYLPRDQQSLVTEYGVKDSKALSDSRILEIASYLEATVTYHLTVCPPLKYNEATQTRNANSIKVSLHNHTLQRLWAKMSSQERENNQGVLIDQFVPESSYYQYLKSETHAFPGRIYFEKKGESHHLAVACASIIARAAFLKSLAQLGKPYGKTLPSGAGAKVDVFGKELVTKYGPEVLESLAKLHFANTQKILKGMGRNT